MKKRKFKFTSPAPPLSESELARLRPHFREWTRLTRLARAKAECLFKAYENLSLPDFLHYLNAHPPTPHVISLLLAIAVAADDPEKPHRLGKRKAQILYGSAKAAALAAWDVYCNSPTYKSKNHFAQAQAKKLKYSNGKSIAATTIYRWLPTKKK